MVKSYSIQQIVVSIGNWLLEQFLSVSVGESEVFAQALSWSSSLFFRSKFMYFGLDFYW